MTNPPREALTRAVNAAIARGEPVIVAVPPLIKLRYRSCDGVNQLKTFKTLEGAQKWAHNQVGKHPDLGSTYAVSFDGIGTVTPVQGVTLAQLFPPNE